MHCTHCGQKLAAGVTTCSRCGTNLAPGVRTKRLVHSVLFFLFCSALAALLIYVVLLWHDAQIFS